MVAASGKQRAAALAPRASSEPRNARRTFVVRLHANGKATQAADRFFCSHHCWRFLGWRVCANMSPEYPAYHRHMGNASLSDADQPDLSQCYLRMARVLIVAGSENDARNSSKQGAESYRAAVWDPTGTDESSIAVQNLTYDVFCSGTAALPDGRSLVVGGTSITRSRAITGLPSSILGPGSLRSRRAWCRAAGTPRPRHSVTAASWRCLG